MYDESSELDENELKKIIEKALVSDAITVYNMLTKKGIGNCMNVIIIYLYFILKQFDFNFTDH